MTPAVSDSPALRDLPRSARLATPGIVLATLAALFAGFGYLTAYGPHLTVLQSLFRLYDYEEWAHCALVPFIIAGLVWWKRKELAAIPVVPSAWGALPLVLGFGFFWMSHRLDDIYFAFISFQVLSLSLVLFFLGWRWVLGLLFPWLFLVFAWPLFFLDNVIAFPLRMVMSQLSTAVLNLAGLPAVQIGTSIQSAPDPTTAIAVGQRFTVDVADPCSGMRSLFALTMVTALYGFFTMKTWWKHLVLLVCAVPLAIFGNLVRILMLTIGILVLGPNTAIGSLEKPSFYHMFSGFFVFIAALAGMLVIEKILNGNVRNWRDQGRAFFDNVKHPARPTSEKIPKSATTVEDVY